MKEVMDKFFKQLPGYEWGFYRLEFQHRGTVHAHGFVRLTIEGDEQIEDLGSKAKEIEEYIRAFPKTDAATLKTLRAEQKRCEDRII